MPPFMSRSHQSRVETMSDYPSLRQIIEGAIFASGSPISVDKILSLFEGDQPTREQIG